MKVIAFVSTIIFVTTNANATIFYVDNAPGHNGSDNNSGTSSAPFFTIQKCASVAKAGDVCTVNDGIYTTSSPDYLVDVRVSGVTFQSKNKYGAKLNGSNNRTARAFDIVANNISIRGFEIFGFNAMGINAGAVNLVVSGNKFHDIGRYCTNSQYGIVGIYFYGSNSTGTIEQNEFFTIGRFANGQNGCSTTEGKGDHGIYIHDSAGLTIKNNVFYDIINGFSIHVFPKLSTNLKILNNTFSDASPYTQGQIILAAPVTSSEIANNIFYRPTVAAINIAYYASLSGITVRNNLTTSANMFEQERSPIATPSGVYAPLNYPNTDPKFLNATLRDFRLQSTSFAIDNGVAVGVLNDIVGTTRPQGNGFDIGAYEFLSGGTPIITKPAPPQNLWAH
jgi:hypothetical protein